MRIINRDLLELRIDSSLKCDLADSKIAGAALYVSQNGEIIFNKAVGISNREGQPVSQSTLFRLASMTKPITACATMLLSERGLLSLDDTVDRFFPDFRSLHISKINEAGEIVDCAAVNRLPTIRNILSHTSGIGSGILGAKQIGKMTACEKETLQGTINYFAKQGLSFEPGTKQEYSGFPAYDVLTGIIEKVADEDYNSFLKREILEPCNMFDTTFVPTDSQWAAMAVMHDRINGENNFCETKPGTIFEGIPCTHYLGGAGLASTLLDYSNFAEMLRQNGVFNGKRILSEDSVFSIVTPQVPKQIQPGIVQWGLGVRVITGSGGTNLPIGSYGWSGAYGPHFWIDPENQIVAIYMKNSFYDPGAGSLTGNNFESDVYHSFY